MFEIDLKYLAIVHNSVMIEKCMKTSFKNYQYIKNKEIYKVDIVFLEKILNKCSCEEIDLYALIF